MDTATRRKVLGLFAKAPVAGQVKTRIAQETSPEWAAALAEAFLGDLLDRCRIIEAERIVVYAPRAAEEWFTKLASPAYQVEAQTEGDLGQRLKAFFGRHLRETTDRVIA